MSSTDKEFLSTIVPFLLIITIFYFLVLIKKKKVFEEEEWETKGNQSQIMRKIINDFCIPSDYKIVKEEDNIIVYKSVLPWTRLIKEVQIEIYNSNNNGCNIKIKFIYSLNGILFGFDDDKIKENMHKDISSIKNIIGVVITNNSENNIKSILCSDNISINLLKYFNLFKNEILTEKEYEDRKNELIKDLSQDRLNENIEDFLSKMLELKNKGILNVEDLRKIKSALI